jgi:hypothetical protein
MMSVHPIPADIDPVILGRAIDLRLLRPNTWAYLYEQGPDQNPTALQFEPDLDLVEERELQKIFAYAASFTGLQTPPDWANWTYQQAEDHIKSAILNGKSLAEINADIEALPGTVDGMRTGLRQVAGALLAVRAILVAEARAILYLRNLILRLRN